MSNSVDLEELKSFECQAAEFYEVTDIMAPGKDDALGTHSEEYRRGAWATYQAIRSELHRLRKDEQRINAVEAFLRDTFRSELSYCRSAKDFVVYEPHDDRPRRGMGTTLREAIDKARLSEVAAAQEGKKECVYCNPEMTHEEYLAMLTPPALQSGGSNES